MSLWKPNTGCFHMELSLHISNHMRTPLSGPSSWHCDVIVLLPDFPWWQSTVKIWRGNQNSLISFWRQAMSWVVWVACLSPWWPMRCCPISCSNREVGREGDSWGGMIRPLEIGIGIANDSYWCELLPAADQCDLLPGSLRNREAEREVAGKRKMVQKSQWLFW